jgi:hypothetical protein
VLLVYLIKIMQKSINQKTKRKWIKVVLFIFAIGIVIIALIINNFFENKKAWIVRLSDSNKIPMYKFDSYNDYKQNRSEQQAEADDKFIEHILNSGIDFKDGVTDEVSYASNFFALQGFDEYKKGSYFNGMKKFNQAWLISQDNHNVYWGFAIWEKNYAGDCIAAQRFFKKAEDIYSERFQIAEDDYERLQQIKRNLLLGCPK